METVYKDRNEKNCCGCGLCEQLCPVAAIRMERVGGFSYPRIDQTVCIDCGLCRKACSFQKGNVQPFDVKAAFAAVNKEDGVRRQSTSGGVFSALSDWILAAGGTVFGAVYDENMQVRYAAAKTPAQRDRMRGSKYVQADVKDLFTSLETAVDTGRPVLFTGTPCEVAAVRAYLERSKKDLGRFYTADLICHGVPSPAVWEAFVKEVQQQHGKRLADFCFRDKEKGWHGYRAKATFADGREMGETPLLGSFGELYSYDLCLRPGCTNCPYTVMERQGDVTIGDFWGVEQRFPAIHDEKGVSALLINTQKGMELKAALEKSMTLYPCDPADIGAHQPATAHPTKPSVRTEEFWRDFYRTPFREVLKKYTRVGWKRRLKDKIQKFRKYTTQKTHL